MKKLGTRLLVFLLIVGFTVSIDMPVGSVQVSAAESVVISAKKATLYIGETLKLSLNGAEGDISWASSKPKVAKVSSKGKVTALSIGTTTITAICSGASYSCKITVEGASLNQDEVTLLVGESFKLKVTGGVPVSYETSSKKVAKVSEEGKIVAKGTGNANITAVLESGEELECKLTVRASEELSAKEVYSKCQNSVVEVDAGSAIGSGFFIAENQVVTNYHVIDKATSLSVKTLDEKKHKVTKVLGYSEKLDLAILEVDYTGVPMEINTHGLTMGETTYTIGSSLGLTNTFSNGMVSNTSRKIDGVEFIQTNTAISHGNSGGPLINAYGEVIGVTTAYYTEGQNLNIAINISELEKVKTNKPLTVKKFISKVSSGSSTDNNTKNTSGKAKPDITALLYIGDYSYTNVCAIIIKNNGKKQLKIGGTSGDNMVLVYPYSNATYTAGYLVDPNTAKSINSKTIKAGESDACFYLLDEERYFSSYDACMSFVFYYDGVRYIGIVDIIGNFTYSVFD